MSRQTWWLALALAILTTAAFAAVRHHDFVSVDDPEYVTANPHIAGGLSWSGIAWAFTSGYAANWHPLTWLSHMLDIQLFGMTAGGPHVMSLMLHVVSTLLLFALLVRMTGAAGRSACVAALFAMHPLHVESVAWIAERKDVLSGACWWLTLLAYAAYVRRPNVARYLAVAAAYALGLMAKPMLVTLPVTLLLIDVWPLGRLRLGPRSGNRIAAWRPLVREKLPFFAMAAGSSLITFVVQQRGGAVRGLDALPLALRVENALVTTVAYAGKMLWPANLAVYYPHPESFPLWEPISAALFLIGVSVFAVRIAPRAPYVVVGWFWYLVTLLPIIGLVQVGTQAMADRYTYVPLVGLFIIVAWGVPDLLAGVSAAWAAVPAAVAVILACAALTRAQVDYWQNTVTLWTHAVDATSNVNNYGAHHTLGLALRDQGRLDEAIVQFREAVRLDPHFAIAQSNLAQALLKRGRAAEAIPVLVTLTGLRPNDARAQADLGYALSTVGRANEAVLQFTASLRLQPDQDNVRNNLGSTLAQLGRTDEALGVLMDLTREKPGYAEAQNNLGRVLAGAGRAAEARAHFEEAVRLKPDFADAHANLGLALAAEGRIRDGTAEISEAIRLAPESAEAHCNLGLILAAEDKLPEAIVEFAEAVRLAPGLERARVSYGMTLARAGRYDEAARELQAALRINPGNATAQQALAALGKRR
jgi:tetratricopeptide (TPR) repeat protein